MKWFVHELKSLASDVSNALKKNIPIITSPAEQENFLSNNKCHICSNEISSEEEKVRDHCHFTGKYRGPAHNKCNLSYRNSAIIPIVFHNLSGYDSHFIIKQISLEIAGEVTLIPNSYENYISFIKTIHIGESKIRLQFIDLFQFMASSLDQLAAYLPSEKKEILHS